MWAVALCCDEKAKEIKMYEIEMFPSRFYVVSNAFNHKELMTVLNTIKKDTNALVSVSSPIGGPTYKTNFIQKEIHGELFNPIVEQLDNWLAKDNVSFDLDGSVWYAEYGEYDYHETHQHDSGFSLNQPDHNTRCFRYSGVICLSNFGATSFVNPNSSSIVSSTVSITSEYNKVILFPSNIYHYVLPHGIKDKVRATFSFNCVLTLKVENV